MSEKSHILLVDDDRTYTPLLQEYLMAKGFAVALRHNAEDGLAAFCQGQFDLCVLDVKMPMKDGFALAEEIRQHDGQVPFIFLSAQSEREVRIRGLTIGADDYVTKPFSMEELYLRITGILRRTGLQQQRRKENPQIFKVGQYRFDPVTRELLLNGATQKLTATESKLLAFFLESETGIIGREQALRRIWGDENSMRGRSLNVYVSKLRQFLKDDPSIEILNVHGEGYRLAVRG